MAWVNRNRCFVALMVFATLFLLPFAAVFFGNPLHDFNLWRLRMRYEKMAVPHPAGTFLVEQKRYLGGPWDHGSSHCIYAIGEIRTTLLPRREIRNAYQNLPDFGTKSHPAKFEIYFPNDRYVSMDSPIGDWFDEIRRDEPVVAGAEMRYLLYVAQDYAYYFGDQRCRGT